MKNRTFLAIIAGWLAAGTVNDAYSGEAEAARSGAITGRVFSAATGSALTNARVTVQRSSRGTTTDDGGRFLLTGIPARQTRIIIEYIGLESEIVTIDVPADGVVEREVALQRIGAQRRVEDPEIVRLSKFTVVEDSEMSAQAIAMNEQRNSASLKNVVAMSEFGDRGNENIGEYLLFLPGVSILNSGAEADAISLRGMPANHTGLMLDGAQMASAETNTRTVSLRAVPMANISRVEVTKVPTPDVPASGLGGTINLISAGGFDKKEAEFNYNVYWQFHNTTGLTLDGGRRWHLQETTAKYNQPSFDFRYTKPVSRNFALTISAARTWRINPEQVDESAGWDLVRNVQTRASWGRITQVYKTVSGQLGADWRVSPNGTLSASFKLRHYTRPTTRSDFRAGYGSNASGDGTYTQGAAAGVDNVSHGTNWRVDTLDTTQGTVKYRHQGNGWRFDTSTAWSESKAGQEDVSRGFFTTAAAQIPNLVLRGDDIPASGGIIPRRFSAVDRAGVPVDIYNGENYPLANGQSGEYASKGQIRHGRIDLTREFDVRMPLTVKVGAAVNQEKRDFRGYPRVWNFRPNGATDVVSRRAGNFNLFDEEFLRDPPKLFGVPYRLLSQKKAFELMQQHPDWFVLDEPGAHQNLVNNSREYSETISAAYVRTDLRLLRKRLWIATGIRFERTAGEGRGPLDDINAQYQRDASGDFIRNSAGNRVLVTSDALALRKLRFEERGAHAVTDYSDVYPSFNATFDLTERLVLRAAYAKTIGRPDLNFITPGVTISSPEAASPRITINNPRLKPWTADNWDFAMESYNFKGGFGSVGVFRKDIEDFFGSLNTPATPQLLEALGLENDPAYANYSISSRNNVGNAKVNGLEFGYRQSLLFLPHWARGIQVFFNATRLKMSGDRTADFGGFNPATYSGGINFVRARFYVKLNYSYLDETRTSLVAESATIPRDTYIYQGAISRYGVSAQYAINRRVAFYMSMTDVSAINKLTTTYAPQTPDWARKARYQGLGYYTTIGMKGSF